MTFPARLTPAAVHAKAVNERTSPEVREGSKAAISFIFQEIDVNENLHKGVQHLSIQLVFDLARLLY